MFVQFELSFSNHSSIIKSICASPGTGILQQRIDSPWIARYVQILSISSIIVFVTQKYTLCANLHNSSTKKHVISASQHVEILAVAFRFCASKDFESSNELLTFNPLKNACQSKYCTNLLSGLVSPAIQVRFLWLIWSCYSGNYWKFVNWLSVPTFVFYLVFFVLTRLFDSK